MEDTTQAQPRSKSASSNSSGNLFDYGDYIIPTQEEIDEKEKRLAEKEAKRKELNDKYHNCYFGL